MVIPARYQSSRLPGKPLALVGGRPMVVCAAQQAAASGAAKVVVATDDVRIQQVVQAAGYQACITREEHQSGSDRIVEVAEQLGWPDDTIIVNVQGDEPLIPPAVIDQVAATLVTSAQSQTPVQVATLCEPITNHTQLFDPNAVKVVFDTNQRALYFSRAPIPFNRDMFSKIPPTTAAASAGGQQVERLEQGYWWRHIGIYGYSLGALRQFVCTPAAPIEMLESLEQLRFMHMGVAIHVYPACAEVPGGIDTPEDLAAVNQLLADAGTS